MLRLIIILYMTIPAVAVVAQSIPEAGAAPRLGIIYNHETTFNMKLATNRGFIIGIEKGRLRSYDRTTFYHISLGELRSPRETRQSAPPQTRYRAYVFGKQNSIWMLRGGWGAKKYFSEKAKVKGVAVGMSYSFGPSLGIIKPYYLALSRTSPDRPTNFIIRQEKYSEENANIFLENSRILGAAPFSKGLSELSFMPMGNASIAFHMDWGAFDENVKALEIGAMIDVAPRAVPILVTENNSPIYLNFFVNLQLGKRK